MESVILCGNEKTMRLHRRISELPITNHKSQILTLAARANLPQMRPGVDPQIVVVVPSKSDRIFSHRLGRQRLCRRLEHWQGPGSQLWRLARLAPSFFAFFVTQRARAGVP